MSPHSDTAGFIATTAEDAFLVAAMISAGDTVISASSFRNTASSCNDYAIGTSTISSGTTGGNFVFNALEDTLTEGSEAITLTIKDTDRNPSNELVASGAAHEFTIYVRANDDAARFSEWSRNDSRSQRLALKRNAPSYFFNP